MLAVLKAIVVHEHGGPQVLAYEDVPVPSPAPNEVLVCVRAAGVGPWDALVREGKSALGQTLPLTPGSDVAGTVFLSGDPAIQFKPGDDVYGVTNPQFTGGYAEFALCAVGMIAAKPPILSYVEAASVPVVAVTAWQMLFEHADIKRGQFVLVHGAAGNVGAYAVQLAKHAGAYVFAAAYADDRAYVEGLRADRFIDYNAERFEDVARDTDVVIDTIGGEMLDRSFGTVRKGGIIVSVVSQPSEQQAARFGVRTAYFIVDVTTARLQALTPLFETGVLETHVGEVLDLKCAQSAHLMLNGALHRRGKIVLAVRDDT